jgi:hypothetical protein
MVPQLLFADRTRSINLISKNEERNLGQFLNRQKRIKLGFRLGKALKIRTVDEENDAVNFGEVVAPETSG